MILTTTLILAELLTDVLKTSENVLGHIVPVIVLKKRLKEAADNLVVVAGYLRLRLVICAGLLTRVRPVGKQDLLLQITQRGFLLRQVFIGIMEVIDPEKRAVLNPLVVRLTL